MNSRIGYIFGAFAHALYTRNILDPQDTDAWKYFNIIIQDLQCSTDIPAKDPY